MILKFLRLEFRFQTWESGPREEISRRIRIWGPKYTIVAFRGQKIGKTYLRKFICLLFVFLFFVVVFFILLVIFWPGFRILDMSGSQNIQFCMRNPIFRSKTSNFCVQKGKIRKNEIRKTYVLISFSFFLFFIGS